MMRSTVSSELASTFAKVADLEPKAQVTFLSELGHRLTVIARSAYQPHGQGVTDPLWFREQNEANHYLFQQIGALSIGKTTLPTYVLLESLATDVDSTIAENWLRVFQHAVDMAWRLVPSSMRTPREEVTRIGAAELAMLTELFGPD